MADVIGMADTRYAIEVAAAGGHHLMLTGPKGSGKTTLAERIPGLLPDLTDDESLELTAVHSLCGALPAGASRLTRPPFRAPHHSASRSGHPRRRQRTGASRRGEQGPPRGAVPRRVPAVPARRRRGPARAAGGRRDLDLARRGGRHLPGADDVRLRLQPVSLRRVPPLLARPPLHLPGGEAPRVPRARSPARSPTGSTSPGSSSRSARSSVGPEPAVRPARVECVDPGSRHRGPAAPAGRATPGCPGGSTPTSRDRRCGTGGR